MSIAVVLLFSCVATPILHTKILSQACQMGGGGGGGGGGGVGVGESIEEIAEVSVFLTLAVQELKLASSILYSAS